MTGAVTAGGGTATPAHPASAGYRGFGTTGYRAYVLAALCLVYVFNFIDRVLITIVQEPVRHEFHLSDLQLGLLGGPTFAILYTLLGIPIARLAERKNRITILAIGAGVWSAATALCGLTSSYGQLLMARIGVSVGEAGCTPPAQSAIGDYFPADKRATAIAIYSLGVPIGAGLAAVGGGFIAQQLGWHQAFFFLGMPGLALAIIVKLTVREPPRQTAAKDVPSFTEAFAALAKKPTFWHVSLAAAAAAFTGYGVGQFTNSFFIRTHGLGILQASQITGLLQGVFGALGTFTAGYIADRVQKRHPNALAWLPLVGFVIATPLNILGYTTASLPLAVTFLALAFIFQYFYLGSQYSITQGIVHPRMRATAVAILLLIINLLGYGLGPPAIGAVSDFLANTQLSGSHLTVQACKTIAEGAAEAPACAAATAFGLKYAIVLGFLGYLWAATHMMFAWKTMQKDWRR